jgi:uncharacterized phage-associated protein
VPLFCEPIEAWANGPVCYTLFQAHRGRFNITAGDVPGDPSVLTVDARETIDAVLDSYGHLTGFQLSALTHQERPWVEARGDVEPGVFSRTPLDLDVMQEFFSSQILAEGGAG